MNILKSIHNYLCKPMNISTYEYFIGTVIAIAIHDLLD